MLIYHALVDLLRNQGRTVESIHVSDLSTLSTVSRGTFYRHFDQIIDVLTWVSDAEMQASCERVFAGKNLYLFNQYFFKYWYQHSDHFELLTSIGRSDIFLNSLVTTLNEYSPVFFCNSSLTTIQQQYLINIWASIQWTILKQWIMNGQKEPIEELAAFALRNLPLPD
jgi:hypothetical protein